MVSEGARPWGADRSEFAKNSLFCTGRGERGFLRTPKPSLSGNGHSGPCLGSGESQNGL